MQPKLIILDLNKTLIHENSWLDLNLALGVTQAEDDILMSWAEQSIVTDEVGQGILCEIYKQRGDVSRTNIESILKNYTYIDGALEIVRELLAREYQLALVSGAMDILVAHVAEELGIQHWRAGNTFIFNSADKLERIDAPIHDATNKADQAQEICNELNIKISDCVAIGDGANDIELFNRTGHGVTFTGSKIADKAEYVIDSLRELLTIIK